MVESIVGAFDGLQGDLVLAVIAQESRGDPWTTRYEPVYRFFYKTRPLFDRSKSTEVNRTIAHRELGPTEFHAQSMSWGLMQVMGAVARELGINGSLAKLCDPRTGIEYGCMHLWQYAYRNGNAATDEALSRYNGGGSREYANEVMTKRFEIERALA